MTKLFAPHMPCEWRDLKFKDGTERQIFEKVFVAIVLQRQKSAERKSPKKYFSYVVLLGMYAPEIEPLPHV